MKATEKSNRQVTKRQLNIYPISRGKAASCHTSPRLGEVPVLAMHEVQLSSGSTAAASQRLSLRSFRSSYPSSPRYVPCLQSLYASIHHYMSVNAKYITSESDLEVQEAVHRLEQSMHQAECLLLSSTRVPSPKLNESDDLLKMEERMSGLIDDIETSVLPTQSLPPFSSKPHKTADLDYKELCLRLETALKRYQDEHDSLKRQHFQDIESIKTEHLLEIQTLQMKIDQGKNMQEELKNSQNNVKSLMKELKKANILIEELEGKTGQNRRELKMSLEKLSEENRVLAKDLHKFKKANDYLKKEIADYKSSVSKSVDGLTREIQRILSTQERLEMKEERMKMRMEDLEASVNREGSGYQVTLSIPRLGTSQDYLQTNQGEELDYDVSGFGRMMADTEEDPIVVKTSSDFPTLEDKLQLFELMKSLFLSNSPSDLHTAITSFQCHRMSKLL